MLTKVVQRLMRDRRDSLIWKALRDVQISDHIKAEYLFQK